MMYYVLKTHRRSQAGNVSNKGEYTYIHARIEAPNKKAAAQIARENFGDDVTVVQANPGYKEGR